MPRPKTKVDKDEVDEIISLYIQEKLNGITSDLTGKGVVEFNKTIANNPDYRRKNGSLFSLYKYNFWLGSYKNKDGYGKVRINEFKNGNEISVVEKLYEAEVIDIIQAVETLHDTPQLLASKLSKMFMQEKNKNKKAEKKVDALEKEIAYLKEQARLFDSVITNIMYQSQSPANSLNDMLRVSREEDAYCYAELSRLFDNGGFRIKELVNFARNDEKKKNNLISIEEKIKNRGFDEL